MIGCGTSLNLFYGQEADFYYLRFKGCIRGSFLLGFGNLGENFNTLSNAIFIERNGVNAFLIRDMYYDTAQNPDILVEKLNYPILNRLTILDNANPNTYDAAGNIDVTIKKSRYIYDTTRDYQIDTEKIIYLRILYYSTGVDTITSFNRRPLATYHPGADSAFVQITYPFYN